MTLARVLEMPKPAVNEALLAAGYAPEFQSLTPDHVDLKPAMSAIMTILENHQPMPAIVIDGSWNIVGGNKSAKAMMAYLPFNGSLCLVDALLNDDPNDPIFLNWSVIATWSVLRLQHENTMAGGRDDLRKSYQRLLDDSRLKPENLTSFADYGPVLTMKVRFGDQILTLFTMLAEFSTVQDITMSERRVELFFAADGATKAFFDSLS